MFDLHQMFIAEGIQMLQQWMLSEKLTRDERWSLTKVMDMCD